MIQAFPHRARWGRTLGRRGVGGGSGKRRKRHLFANHVSWAMKFPRLGAHQVHFKDKCREGVSVTQGSYLWKMTVCKYLNLGEACASDTEESLRIGRVSSQHLFHHDLSNLHWRLDRKSKTHWDSFCWLLSARLHGAVRNVLINM